MKEALIKNIINYEIETSKNGIGEYKLFSITLRLFKYDYSKTRLFLLDEGFTKTEVTNLLSKWIHAQKKTKKYKSSVPGCKIFSLRY